MADNGYKSRKFWFGVGTSVAMIGSAVLAGSVFPGMAALLPTLYGSLMAVLGLYVGGNLGHKVIDGKTAPAPK